MRTACIFTEKGKAFYSQLMENPYIAISGMCGGDGTMNKKPVSIRGKAVNIGSARLKEVFEENPYMAEIYPQEEHCLHCGNCMAACPFGAVARR